MDHLLSGGGGRQNPKVLSLNRKGKAGAEGEAGGVGPLHPGGVPGAGGGRLFWMTFLRITWIRPWSRCAGGAPGRSGPGAAHPPAGTDRHHLHLHSGGLPGQSPSHRSLLHLLPPDRRGYCAAVAQGWQREGLKMLQQGEKMSGSETSPRSPPAHGRHALQPHGGHLPQCRPVLSAAAV